ncbi:hypothetical protein [Salinibacter phage M31CR41-2]|uniref:Uncharacterized protein n=2 Tax=Kairosalinivirus TaxID=2560158 RepID=A0A2I6UHA4_9CAUD|nr:hypothetical protein FGG68_gp36 [Salinibacter phage M31CR41-2]YP_009639662.1 hypothetical protein FGG69_gp50 [Salinibacter phage SRUTV-1]ATU47051.1 hypothetical protein [Salinibacter phage SRUTV-1]AUO79321.1 hypothetical protein [Salinibacter phage M31CR41-2]AUO79391.1 hypothetical protein [Salinibacter virus M31CR41-3]
MAQFSRYSEVIVDLTDRGHGRRKALVSEVYGSNKLHDYLVKFPDGSETRRVRVHEGQVSEYTPDSSTQDSQRADELASS